MSDKQKWTQEPWVKDYGQTKGHIKSMGAQRAGTTPTVARYDIFPDRDEEQNANAERICSCVNALSGLNPEGVAKVVEALKALLAEVHRLHDMDATSEKLGNAVNASDAALRALQQGGGE